MKIDPDGLSYRQINDVLIKIAHFHAVGYAYQVKNSSSNQRFESWQLQNSSDPEFIKLVGKCFDDFIKDLQTEDPKLVKVN